MRKLALAFLLCLTSSIANAQAFEIRKSLICDETQKVVKALAEKFNEKPVWVARDIKDDSKYSLFVNPKTGSWTLLQMTPDVSCILGVGEESNLLGEII